MAEFQDVRLPYQRFAAGHHVKMDAQRLSLGNDFIHIIVGKVQRMSVFGSPAAYAVAVACAGGIKKDDPGNIDAVFLPVFPAFLISIKSRFKSQVHDSGLDDVGIQGVQGAVQVFPPFMVVAEKPAHLFKGGPFKHAAIHFFNHVGQTDEGLSSLFFVFDGNNVVYQSAYRFFLNSMCQFHRHYLLCEILNSWKYRFLPLPACIHRRSHFFFSLSCNNYTSV